MSDQIVRAITSDGLVKASAITGTELVERARQIHRLLPVATAALGRALMGASMMGDQLKEERGKRFVLHHQPGKVIGIGNEGIVVAVRTHIAPDVDNQILPFFSRGFRLGNLGGELLLLL